MLISDVIMPGLDGPSLLKKARPYLGDAPVMFISGYAESDFSDLLQDEVGVSFLPKPLDIKTLAERSEPDSVWRDVAGMPRSFAYATSACENPHSDQAQQWYQATSQAFLQAYQRVTGQSRMNEEALRAYITDKAVYEVVYETRNRPTWVDIPLGALRSLTSD